MTVIEARGRGGQLLERFRCNKAVITVGRAFDNDVILEDEYVSPHHFRLSKLENGWRFEDIDSLNGMRIGRRRKSGGVIHSGAELRVGHTSLHIYDDHHPVEATLKLDGAEARISSLGRHGVWSLLLVTALIVSATTLYWGTFDEFKPLTILDPLVTTSLRMFGIAAFWALLGRLLRHKAYFFAHLSIWTIFSLLSRLAQFLSDWFAYNANSQLLADSIQQSMSFCILALAAWGSMALATNLRNTTRFYAAGGVAVVVLAIGLAGQLRFEQEFLSYPDYYAKIMAPVCLFATPVEESRLIDELPALFDRADLEIEEIDPISIDPKSEDS